MELSALATALTWGCILGYGALAYRVAVVPRYERTRGRARSPTRSRR
ncbi:hypothetical protein [Halomarina ordinaria]|uniref:Uncharacterized protein n=1 Tax=Halomarina ordinaria TaxID=3033939 RepID=A0ABD5UA26_9EURY|nr:hypothetical protein [Halomarina sp. PSRA2]